MPGASRSCAMKTTIHLIFLAAACVTRAQGMLDLEPQPLGQALLKLANMASVNVIFKPSDVSEITAPALRGVANTREALCRLLSGTSLRAKYVNPHTIRIERQQDQADHSCDAVGRSAAQEKTGILIYSQIADVKSDNKASTAISSSFRNRDDVPTDGTDYTRGAGGDEVIVTARKMSERLQDVPFSISAISSDALEMSGSRNLQDIAREVPGLNVVTVAPGQNQLIIRGVSSAGGIPTVGYYIDDTPIESIGNLAGSAMDPALLDLQRVEVLRGPQGTLYGASSMGGTVKYVTSQPNLSKEEQSFRASPSLTSGGSFNYEISGLINQPVATDVAALRAIAFYRDANGYIDRYPVDPGNYLGRLSGPKAKNVNTEKTYGGRVGLEFKPVDAISVLPSVFLQRTDLGAPFTIDDPPGSFHNLIQTRNLPEPSRDDLQLFTLTVAGDVAGIHLTSSTAYRNRHFAATEDDSKVAAYFFEPDPQSFVYPLGFQNEFNNHDFTEELRGSGRIGPLHGLLGLFYLHQTNHSIYNFPVTAGYNAAFGDPFGDMSFFDGTDSMHIKQRAIYGELNWDISSRLQATVGIRAFNINQDDHSIFNGVLNGGLSDHHESTTDSGVTPKYEISYHFAPAVLTYLSATKGFRQGGLQFVPYDACAMDLSALGLSSGPASFKSDSLWNYELGVKSQALDRRLTINGSVYYVTWSRVQQLVSLPTCGYVFTGNFGTASSKGGELELDYMTPAGIKITIGAAYNEAKLLSTVPGAQGRAGDTLENAPRWNGSAAVEYHKSIAADTEMFVRLDWSAITRQNNNFDPTSIYYSRAGYAIGGARMGLNYGSWAAAIFVDNLLDRRAETALPLSYAFDLPTTRRLSINRPRTIGLDLRWTH